MVTTMTASVGGGAPLPRKAVKSAKLVKEQKLTLAEQYLAGDDDAKLAIIKRWGRGRVRRSLLEFARNQHELEYRAMRERENI